MDNPQEPVVPQEPTKKSVFREILSTIGILAMAFLVAVGLISFVFQSYQVDGPSMESTLQNQDRLIVWKAQRTWARITHSDYVPNRGDIIVFVESGLSQYGQDNSKQLIKRVIGLPGDHVVIKNGKITISNDKNPDGFNPDKTLPYGSNIPYTSGNVDITLGDKEIFVCGDNRPDSLDSRVFGPITPDQIVGKLLIRIFPANNIKVF
jgi:signal peptidase I